jgi:2-polyprenyl-3-methyl-5-hydroxy-6-metoxy-1,4-benzoquinol methylase
MREVNNAREVATTPAVTMTCLMCGGHRHRRVFEEFGTDIVRCRDCGHVFSSFRSDPHYDGYWGDEVPEADHFYWKTARSSMYRNFLRKFIAGRSGRLLDMGCGLGFFVKTMTSYPAWETYGCEISSAAVRYARERLHLDNVICGRLDEADFPPGSFDVITMWDVIDHIPRPDPVLRHCHALLKDGGVCFIRSPNIRVQLPRARLNKALRGMRPGVAYLQARHHAHHYSRSSLRRLLERNGFSAVSYLHLRPIQDGAGGASWLSRAIKNACFEAVRALAIGSAGHLNFNNLFVIARKAGHLTRMSVGADGRLRGA